MRASTSANWPGGRRRERSRRRRQVGEAAGHDVSIRPFDKGRYARTEKGVAIGKLAERATA